MIVRDISIRFGNALIETTPVVADANVGGEPCVVGALKMKNITDADCVGRVELIFLNKNGLEFFKRKLSEMENIWEEELNNRTNDAN